MRKIYLSSALVGVGLVCGCNKDIRTNTEKIDALTQKMFALQQEQARQLAMLPVQIDKTQFEYFVKSQEKALFYQTNVLFLLVAVDKKIQAQFQEATAAREAADLRAYAFHTNELDLVAEAAGQTAAAMASQEKRIVENLNAEIQRTSASLGTALTNQIRQLAADKSDAARLQALAAQVAQMQRDLELLKARLGITDQPAGGTH